MSPGGDCQLSHFLIGRKQVKTARKLQQRIAQDEVQITFKLQQTQIKARKLQLEIITQRKQVKVGLRREDGKTTTYSITRLAVHM